METPEEKNLEQFIHERLQRLPQHEAPGDLMGNVFAAIRAREARPWWKQSFVHWPRRNQNLLYCLLGALFASTLWLSWKPAASVSFSAVFERLKALSWMAELASNIGSALVLCVRSLSWEWLLGLGLLGVVLYAVCIAGGLALYRVNTRPRSSLI